MGTSDRFAGPLAAAWPTATAEGLLALLLGPDGALPVPSADDRSVWDLAAGSADQMTLVDLRRRAEGTGRAPSGPRSRARSPSAVAVGHAAASGPAKRSEVPMSPHRTYAGSITILERSRSNLIISDR